MPLKRMAGIDEWGQEPIYVYPSTPIWARLKREEIHHETKRGLDQGLVSILHSRHSQVQYMNMSKYLFDQQWSFFFPLQRWWAADVRYNKVRAFLVCTNPVETGSNM